jgi:aminopeptidase
VDGAGADRLQRLADLAVHGANVQPGQVLMITGEIGNEDVARAVAAAGYRRGAKFVDVDYFDPHIKRARIEHASPDSLDFVPRWYGTRMLDHAEDAGARVTLATLTTPNLMDGLDKTLVGRDMLPRVKELTKIVGDRSTNWCIVPAPHRVWAALVYPDLDEDEAYERLWHELEHVLRLDDGDAGSAWDARMTVLREAAERLTTRAFDAIELRGPGTELSVGMLPTHVWWAADFTRADGLRHLPNLPTEEVFTTPDPLRTHGYVTSTKPLALRDGTIIRGLRVRFENGVAVEVEANTNADTLKSLLDIDEGAHRIGELALVDRHGRIGPLGTVFYNTLLDENAASHIALGAGFKFLVDEEVVPRVNESSQHIDFMIGSNEVDVDGITVDGDRIPVLRGGDWQI